MMYDTKSMLQRIAAAGPSLLFDYESFGEIAKAVTDTIDGLRLTIAVTPRVDAPPQYVSLTNYDPSSIDSYLRYFAAINPWVPYYSTMRVGKVTRAEDLVAHEALKRTEFYNDWLKPMGDADGGFGIGLSTNEGASSVMLVNLDYQRTDAEKAEIANVLALASRSIGRILDFRQITNVQDAARMGLVRSAAKPTWLLSRQGHVVDCNVSAEAMMRGTTTLIRQRAGRLETGDVRSQAELGETLASPYRSALP